MSPPSSVAPLVQLSNQITLRISQYALTMTLAFAVPLSPFASRDLYNTVSQHSVRVAAGTANSNPGGPTLLGGESYQALHLSSKGQEFNMQVRMYGFVATLKQKTGCPDAAQVIAL